MADKVPGFELKAFAPPASISGKRIEEHRRTPVKPEGWAITMANKHPVETIKYFDFFFSEEGRRMANFGIEGKHYDMIDGKPIFKPEVLNADKPINAQMWSVGAQFLVVSARIMRTRSSGLTSLHLKVSHCTTKATT